MIDPREYDEYIKSANKSSQVPKVHYNAFTGKRVRKGHLDITREDTFYIIGFLIIISIFMWWIL